MRFVSCLATDKETVPVIKILKTKELSEISLTHGFNGGEVCGYVDHIISILLVFFHLVHLTHVQFLKSFFL